MYCAKTRGEMFSPYIFSLKQVVIRYYKNHGKEYPFLKNFMINPCFYGRQKMNLLIINVKKMKRIGF